MELVGNMGLRIPQGFYLFLLYERTPFGRGASANRKPFGFQYCTRVDLKIGLIITEPHVPKLVLYLCKTYARVQTNPCFSLPPHLVCTFKLSCPRELHLATRFN